MIVLVSLNYQGTVIAKIRNDPLFVIGNVEWCIPLTIAFNSVSVSMRRVVHLFEEGMLLNKICLFCTFFLLTNLAFALDYLKLDPLYIAFDVYVIHFLFFNTYPHLP